MDLFNGYMNTNEITGDTIHFLYMKISSGDEFVSRSAREYDFMVL